MGTVAVRFPQAFRSGVTPERILRHNRAIGSPVQSIVSRWLMTYVLGTAFAIGMRIFFRLKIVHHTPMRSLDRKVIFAARHFYEWDPFFSLTALAWRDALRRPGIVPCTVAGDFWFRSPILRATLWFLNILCLVRDREPAGGAMSRVAEMLADRPSVTALLFPTGPIGRSKAYRVKPGIGWLAQERPDVQIVPVTMIGLQDVRLRDVLLLRRPPLTVAAGRPFRGRDVAGATRDERELAACRRIDEEWQVMERAELETATWRWWSLAPRASAPHA
jgi:1-acyl-sn-glycerol-3-phosphate acyltransferase